MTDKERFEKLAYNVGISLEGEKVMVSSEHYDFLYNYAVQQTERVEELEKINIDAIIQIDVTQRRNERLEKRVQELETTVDFYQSALKDADRRVQELEEENCNLKESAYKMQMNFIDANKHRNIYKEQNKRYRKAIENIKKYNQKALKVDDYTKSEALLDISLEIMKLEGEE